MYSIEHTPIIVFLSTYPPRECGIATFTKDLLSLCVKNLGAKIRCKVAAFNLTPLDTYTYPKEVEWEIDQDSKVDHLQLAKEINENADITGVIIQHEYGIFGGIEGEKILHFMQNCTKPMLLTLHTILPLPSPKMYETTKQLVRLAKKLVVLTENSKEMIEKIYPESIGKIFLIPHGIHHTPFSTQKKYKAKLELKKRIVLSTFGLLSPGKGIEYVIKALPDVVKKYPTLVYLILGETHPVIRRKEGEQYRLQLSLLVRKLKLQKYVRFYDQYLHLPELLDFLKATDIYISTSTNPNQAVSGTLSYALGTGRPVISTEFEQAKEIVTPDVGKLIPMRNSVALTTALFDLLGDEDRLRKMSCRAYEKTRPMLWENVAQQYIDLLTGKSDLIDLRHLFTMTDSFGIFQFSTFAVPNKMYGYTLDDNARALIFCVKVASMHPSSQLQDIMTIYLRFIHYCLQPNGLFVNYISFLKKTPTPQNISEDLHDANARALWALAEVMCSSSVSDTLRETSKTLFLQAYNHITSHEHLRAKAFTIKALALAQGTLLEHRKEIVNNIRTLADELVVALDKHSNNTWTWFEEHLGYGNGVLPESLCIAGTVTQTPRYLEKGLLALQFLIKETFSLNMYHPIGHSDWYTQYEKRSAYDQQPEDPASMIVALVRAYQITHEENYKTLAKKCFRWFFGNNTLQMSLVDETTGGCYDGLHPDRVNLNQGAESLVSYLMSTLVMKELDE